MKLNAETKAWLVGWRLMVDSKTAERDSLMNAHTQAEMDAKGPEGSAQDLVESLAGPLNRLFDTYEVQIKAETVHMLKELSDDALMELDLSLMHPDQPIGTLPYLGGGPVYNEVKARASHACIIWRRWRKPADCTRWLEHLKTSEELAKQLALKIVSNLAPQSVVTANPSPVTKRLRRPRSRPMR